MSLKFSVILPVYNKVEYNTFKLSFDSLLNQSLKPNELIVIFDGPIKNEIKKYLNKKIKIYKFIRLVKYSKNRGLGVVLKKGAKLCKYPYIARCDADDISLPNRFKLQIRFLRKNQNIDILGSNISEIKKDKLISRKKVPKLHKDICSNIFIRNPINHSSVILKKKAILNAGNYEDLRYFEDYFLWIKVFLNGGEFHNLQNYLVNMSVDDDYFKRRSGFYYLRYYFNFLKKLKNKNMINYKYLLFNLLIRTIIILMPIFILKKIYKFFFRD
jgi:glycosyltransferase involved in cell wall biosynthesis